MKSSFPLCLTQSGKVPRVRVGDLKLKPQRTETEVTQIFTSLKSHRFRPHRFHSHVTQPVSEANEPPTVSLSPSLKWLQPPKRWWNSLLEWVTQQREFGSVWITESVTHSVQGGPTGTQAPPPLRSTEWVIRFVWEAFMESFSIHSLINVWAELVDWFFYFLFFQYH